jgi:hypothetical protein
MLFCDQGCIKNKSSGNDTKEVNIEKDSRLYSHGKPESRRSGQFPDHDHDVHHFI